MHPQVQRGERLVGRGAVGVLGQGRLVVLDRLELPARLGRGQGSSAQAQAELRRFGDRAAEARLGSQQAHGAPGGLQRDHRILGPDRQVGEVLDDRGAGRVQLAGPANAGEGRRQVQVGPYVRDQERELGGAGSLTLTLGDPHQALEDRRCPAGVTLEQQALGQAFERARMVRREAQRALVFALGLDGV